MHGCSSLIIPPNISHWKINKVKDLNQIEKFNATEEISSLNINSKYSSSFVNSDKSSSIINDSNKNLKNDFNILDKENENCYENFYEI